MSFLPTIKPIQFKTESSDWQEFTIDNFTPGLCTAQPKSNILDNQFTSLSNWLIEDDGSVKVRGPFRPYNVATEDTVLPDSAPPLNFTWVTLGVNDYLISSWDNGSYCEVSYYDETNNRWSGEGGGTTIKADLDDDYKVEFVKFSTTNYEDLIFCNGKDTPQRWTSSGASTDLGLSAPDAPSSLSGSESTGVGKRGLYYTGNYYYKFTAFYDGVSTKYGESGPSDASSAIAITGTETEPSVVSLTNCPTIPTGATKVYVYRSPCGEVNGPYEQVGYYESGTSFDDTTPDDEGGEQPPTDAGTPPYLKNPLFAKGRLWGVGLNSSGGLKNKMVYSEDGIPDMFLAKSYAYFPDDYTGSIEFRENVYHFTKKQIYVTPNGDPVSYPLPLKICEKGSNAFGSIVDVGNGIVFQADDNIYWVDFNTQAEDGDFPIPIGDPIKDKIKNIPALYRANSRACLHNGRYYISFTGPNQTLNTQTLVWDVEQGVRLMQKGIYGGWSTVDWRANDMQDFNGTLYTSDNTNKYIMEHEFASVDDYLTKTLYDAGTSQTIATAVQTKLYHFGHESASKIIGPVSVASETSGISMSATLAFNDNTYNKSKTFSLGSGTTVTDSTWLVWDQGTWGNFNWGSVTYGFQMSHQKIASGSKGRNVQLTLTSADSQDTNLIGIKFYYKALPAPI